MLKKRKGWSIIISTLIVIVIILTLFEAFYLRYKIRYTVKRYDNLIENYADAVYFINKYSGNKTLIPILGSFYISASSNNNIKIIVKIKLFTNTYLIYDINININDTFNSSS